MGKTVETISRVVHVGLGDRAYDIHIGPGLLSRFMDFVPETIRTGGRSYFIITDRHAEPYALTIAEQCNGRVMTLPPGEETKSLDWFSKVQSFLLESGVNRRAVLVAVGGGVIGDLAGFCAATVMRGIPFIQIPTTLLAQVDSSVGGKTGINVAQGKNLVGAFHQPVAVIADTDVLKTLSSRDILAGYAEIVKYGLIGDAEFFTWLERHGADVTSLAPAETARAIEVSCRKKAEIVTADERESGVRALLNFGHTFAHAIENAAGYDGSVLHGEAVSVGMVLATALSVRLGFCQPADLDRTGACLKNAGLPVHLHDLALPSTADGPDLYERMQTDKKVTESGMAFILTRGIGGAFVATGVSRDDVLHVINRSLMKE